MSVDLSIVPTTFDSVHVGLAAFIGLLLAMQILLLTVVVTNLVRRGAPTPAVAPTPVEPTPPRAPVAEKAPSTAAPPAPSILKEATPDAALQLLSLLQKEARFIDFVEEPIANYADADIGAAARVVHEGCRKVLRTYFTLEAVRAETESSRVTLPKGFDAGAVRLSGNVVGEPPFSGVLIHRGWRAKQVNLPKLAEGHDVTVVAPAEVEL